ncbi:MAG: hypothetical protein Q9182_000770 [Xanthomendoza sp. 2 TL-2023]
MGSVDGSQACIENVGIDHDSERHVESTRGGYDEFIDQFRRVQLVMTQIFPDEIVDACRDSSTHAGFKYKIGWTREEKQKFRKLVGITGTDWRSLSTKLGTKNPTQLKRYYKYCCLEKLPGIESRAQKADRLRSRSNRTAGTSPLHLFDMSAALLTRMEMYHPPMATVPSSVGEDALPFICSTAH